MLGCYSEIVACSHDCDEGNNGTAVLRNHDFQRRFCDDTMVPAAPFGGFRTWPLEGKDFILLAECSELHGPSPLLTIPRLEPTDVDLNLLCLHILSADFQGLCSNLGAPTKNTQLLMPDVLSHVHAAVNHFTVFDVEARGFVRPLCLAYVTSDKFKLIELSEELFKNLAQAAEYIQLSNCKVATQEIDTLILDSQFKETGDENFLDSVENCNQDDIEDIRCLAQTYKGKCRYADYSECFVLRLKKCVSSEVFENILAKCFSPLHSCKLHDKKFSLSQCSKKNLRHLSTLCPDGMLFGLYHLFITLKYFGRSYEDIFMQQEDRKSTVRSPDRTLSFGACVRFSPSHSQGNSESKCFVLVPNIPKSFDMNDEEYFDCTDSAFGEIVKEFLPGVSQNGSSMNLSEEVVSKHLGQRKCHVCCTYLSRGTESPIRKQPEVENQSVRNNGKDVDASCRRHVFTLCAIWSMFDLLSARNADSVILEILQTFHQSESLFFSLLTRSMIVVICSPEDATPVHLFIEALGTLVPRTRGDKVWVEPCRRKPLEKLDLIHVPVVGFCLTHEESLVHFISPDIMPFISILNLREKSFSGPRYVGSLLSGIDERLMCVQTSGAVFPIFSSILSEVESNVKLWSALSTPIATQHLVQKGFSSCDMKIIETLSKLCIP